MRPSVILQTATVVLQPLLLLFSVFLLLAGHNEPGGGFVGGLCAAASFALLAIAFDVPRARRALRVDPIRLTGAGLLLAGLSGAWALVRGRPFLSGHWTTLTIPGVGKLDVGTPFFFDIGVYVVVVGVTLGIIFGLAEEEA